MDAQAIYSQWKANRRLPDAETVVDLTTAGKTRELEFVAKLYTTVGHTLDLTQAMHDPNLLSVLVHKIPVVWNDTIRAVFTVTKELLDKHADLRVYVGAADAPAKDSLDVDTLTDQMKRLTLTKSADEYIAARSKRNIATLAEMTGARVSMEWVRECASALRLADGQDAETPHFVLLRSTSDRHVHHVNSSVVDFLRALHGEFTDANGLPQTVTWQFSQGSAFAIHLQKFKQAAAARCPEHPYGFIVFACAIGIPIHELMKTRDIVTTWTSSRFKMLNQENVIKVLLRRRFNTEATDIEANTLVRKYVEHIADFRAVGQYNDVDMYFYKMFYSYPDADEVTELAARIEHNTQRWK